MEEANTLPDEVAGEDPLTFVRESEEQRRQRIAELSKSGDSIFSPPSPESYVSDSVTEAPSSNPIEVIEENHRPQRPVRRRVVD